MQATDTWAVPGKEDYELPRVLFIEDNPDDADIVRRVLGDAGVAAVETARTADEGLRIFKKADWDLVLLDYRLPGSSGLDGPGPIAEDRPRCAGDRADGGRRRPDCHRRHQAGRRRVSVQGRCPHGLAHRGQDVPGGETGRCAPAGSREGDRAGGGAKGGDRGGKTASPEHAPRFRRLWQEACRRVRVASWWRRSPSCTAPSECIAVGCPALS